MYKPQLMGIINVTPDSFSDGGAYLANKALMRRLCELLADGADIVDVGGESSRPGALPVRLEEELARVLPALQSIRSQSAVPLALDTAKPEVARQALAFGITIINHTGTPELDEEMAAIALKAGARLVLMHRGGGGSGELASAHRRRDQRELAFVAELSASFAGRIKALIALGFKRERIIIDPGLGFGKSLSQNLAILRHLACLSQHDCPILIGHSRKSFLGAITGEKDPARRDTASAVLSVFCAQNGAHMLRVHNVGATKAALMLWSALQEVEQAAGESLNTTFSGAPEA